MMIWYIINISCNISHNILYHILYHISYHLSNDVLYVTWYTICMYIYYNMGQDPGLQKLQSAWRSGIGTDIHERSRRLDKKEVTKRIADPSKHLQVCVSFIWSLPLKDFSEPWRSLKETPGDPWLAHTCNPVIVLPSVQSVQESITGQSRAL